MIKTNIQRQWRYSRNIVYTLFGLPVVLFCFLIIKSCQNDGNNGFDFKTSARMYPPFTLVDTTKPQTKVKPIITNKYVLSGSDTLFNLLWMQIQSPIDVTPRQLNSLKEWMQKGLRQDTTNIK